MWHTFSQTLGRLARGEFNDYSGAGLAAFYFVAALVSFVVLEIITEGERENEAFCVVPLALIAFLVHFIVRQAMEQRQPPSCYGRIGQLSTSELQAAKDKLRQSRARK